MGLAAGAALSTVWPQEWDVTFGGTMKKTVEELNCTYLHHFGWGAAGNNFKGNIYGQANLRNTFFGLL